ncbi:uncharacterized protein LOC141662100 [Apium graveolens]|uniref:uncharacterized protein LOC141662100 n=1 Tax=Apium graveolens TaxID=4045 RepID=UPI003D7B8942
MDRIISKPANIPLEQFMVILKYWSDEAVQDKAEKNVANRKKVTYTHTAGRTIFAQLRSKMKIANLDGESTTIAAKRQLYPKTRKGHTNRANPDDELADDDNEKTAELDFEAHGPNWLLGRSGRIRKSNKKLEKTGQTDSADVEKMRE